VPGARADIARSAMALAVQHGAKQPDISSAAKFKEALLAAQSLGMSNPVGGGQSGANLIKIFDKLGITEAMQPKSVYGRADPPGSLEISSFARRSEIGIQQLPELMAVPGIDIVGPLPPEIQSMDRVLGRAVDGRQERRRRPRAHCVPHHAQGGGGDQVEGHGNRLRIGHARHHRSCDAARRGRQPPPAPPRLRR